MIQTISRIVSVCILIGAISYSWAESEADFVGVWTFVGVAYESGNRIIGKIQPVPSAIRGDVKLGLGKSHEYSVVPMNWMGVWRLKDHGIVLIPGDYQSSFELFIRTFQRGSRTIHSAQAFKPSGSKMLAIKYISVNKKPGLILFKKTG